jgi:hypothetical protein
MFHWAIWTIAVIFLMLVVWLGGRGPQKRERMTDSDAAAVIDGYLHGGGGDWDWSNLVDRPFRNPRLERLRSVCLEGESKLPDEREAFLSQVIEKLRHGQFH